MPTISCYQNYTAAYPSWFVEGYAEFYATTQIAPDGSIRLGESLNIATTSEDYDGVSLQSLLLANPWELAAAGHFTYSQMPGISSTSSPSTRTAMDSCGVICGLLAAGRPAEAAATEAFGDIGRLSAEFGSQPLATRSLDVLEISFASAPPLPPISIEPLNEAEGEVAMVPAALSVDLPRRGADRGSCARPRARAAAAPTDPATLQLLADAEHLAGNRDAAMRAIDRLLELQPQSPRALLRKGLLEIDALADAEGH